ncbi:hypothetical protein BU14_0025s0011 [Porphyra umbilicalis]|uniref:Uncharacterized protein n=1 Tax=Porphyra umbilicalis TaxID=2786 RepID=A0A1X6PJT4_PORUM|nr:hypothetical protein BU14_0025s0011 [Porphyra umbilicalis]|eukprot:OSX81129.1 hypothetical protein BU14_0025s0011 [Porphyra umbilicalis]
MGAGGRRRQADTCATGMAASRGRGGRAEETAGGARDAPTAGGAAVRHCRAVGAGGAGGWAGARRRGRCEWHRGGRVRRATRGTRRGGGRHGRRLSSRAGHTATAAATTALSEPRARPPPFVRRRRHREYFAAADAARERVLPLDNPVARAAVAASLRAVYLRDVVLQRGGSGGFGDGPDEPSTGPAAEALTATHLRANAEFVAYVVGDGQLLGQLFRALRLQAGVPLPPGEAPAEPLRPPSAGAGGGSPPPLAPLADLLRYVEALLGLTARGPASARACMLLASLWRHGLPAVCAAALAGGDVASRSLVVAILLVAARYDMPSLCFSLVDRRVGVVEAARAAGGGPGAAGGGGHGAAGGGFAVPSPVGGAYPRRELPISDSVWPSPGAPAPLLPPRHTGWPDGDLDSCLGGEDLGLDRLGCFGGPACGGGAAGGGPPLTRSARGGRCGTATICIVETRPRCPSSANRRRGGR